MRRNLLLLVLCIGSFGVPARAGAQDVKGPEAVKGKDKSHITVDSPQALVDALRAQATRLTAREAELDREEARLNTLRSEVEARASELTALRRALDERMANFRDELDARRDAQLKKVVKAMAGMPPEAAASVATVMDEGVVVRIFNLLKARSAAKILAAMPADKAARVTQRLGFYRAGIKGKKKKKPQPKKEGVK